MAKVIVIPSIGVCHCHQGEDCDCECSRCGRQVDYCRCAETPTERMEREVKAVQLAELARTANEATRKAWARNGGTK